jgi:hypothetical protein
MARCPAVLTRWRNGLARGAKVAIIAGLLIIAAAATLAVERDAIIAEWTTIYPCDPAMKMALQLCYIEDRQFNRLSSTSRKNC